MTETERVLIVEPHDACRRGIAVAVEHFEPEMTVVGETQSDAVAASLAAVLDPTLVVLYLAGRASLTAIEEIRRVAPRARVVVLSPLPSAEIVVDALRAGAHGFVPEAAEPEELVDALRHVRQGEPFVETRLLIEAVRWVAERTDDAATGAELTPREHQVLQMLSEGLSASAIAGRLYLSGRTIETHLSSAYHKLGVRGRIQAMNVYRRAFSGKY